MGTEKFIAFKEDGSAYRLKGRILRFLDNEPVSEADKTNIRSTLSVPASGEGLTPANNLSDLSNVATARTNLSVNSIDEDAQAAGTKLVGPALYFDGVNDYLEVADDSKLSFTDGTDDLPFSIGVWAKIEQAENNRFVAKYGNGGASTQEWLLFSNGSGYLAFQVASSGGDAAYITSAADLSSYVGQWAHFAVSYNGAGTNSSNAFSAAMNGAKLFINGEEVASTPSNNASYAGMVDTSQGVWIGRATSVYHKGHIKDVKLYNRSLTATEVAELARGNDLGFSEEWGGAHGGVYSSNFSGGTNGFSGGNAAASGNNDGIGPIGDLRDDNLQLLVNNTSNTIHYVKNTNLSFGKTYKITLDYYIPSSNSNLDGIELRIGGDIDCEGSVLDAWTQLSGTGIAGADQTFYIYGSEGGSISFQDLGADDVLYVRNVQVTQLGALADFRSEDYNESASKLLDRSSNNFVGVGTSVTLTGNQRHISADTIDLKNLPTSSAGLSAGEVWSNGGVLTVV